MTSSANQELMALYKAEKINPLGGCLPVVVQIPVFISLYWVLLASVEIRNAPWLGWIHNLAAPDPFFILPDRDGRIHVPDPENESASTRPVAGQTDDVSADRVFDHILFLSGGSGSVLGRQQFVVNCPAVLD